MNTLVEREIIVSLGKPDEPKQCVKVVARCSTYLAIHPMWWQGEWSGWWTTLTHIPTGLQVYTALDRLTRCFLRMAEHAPIDWSQDQDGMVQQRVELLALRKRFDVILRRWYRMPHIRPLRLRYHRRRPTLPYVLSVRSFDSRYGARYRAKPPRCVWQRITKEQVSA